MISVRYIRTLPAIAVIMLCFGSIGFAESELGFIMSNNPMQTMPKTSRSRIKFSGTNFIFVGAIRFYQLFISTQDRPVCNFTPSCSNFAVEAIRETGVLRGILLASDRLQRCNGMSISRYKVDYKSGILKDPIEIYADLLQKKPSKKK